MAKIIDENILGRSMTYSAYTELAERLAAEGKTTGSEQSESRIDYTRLNCHRMSRIYRTTELTEEVKSAVRGIRQVLYLVVITEAWCGDAANILPVIAKIADENEHLKLRIILRDENPEVMDAYLTEGTRSIPVLVCLDSGLNELFKWGPRPLELQAYVKELRLNSEYSQDEIKKKIQFWYLGNKSGAVQKEISELFKTIKLQKNESDNT